jgi:hypothetical protein
MKTVILGGGTMEPIRNHLALCAPAFGTTAKELYNLFKIKHGLRGMNDLELILTDMAGGVNKLRTNEDVKECVESLINTKNDVGVIVLNVAFCDFKALPIDGIPNGFHAERLKTANGNIKLELEPTEKIISMIRKARPDIFLVGFKTTTNQNEDDQFLTALKFMKSTKCNLVLANDTVTRNNMILTPEETYYGNSKDRSAVLRELVDMVHSRSTATYNRTNFIEGANHEIQKCSKTFQTVVKWLVDNGGFLENNGNGFTPGHFCERSEESIYEFYSSQRKANHNKVFEEGMSRVKVLGADNKDGTSAEAIFEVTGTRKASVGARSQWMLLQENPGYDCIVHTHNPMRVGSHLPVTPQKPYQCGSLECGLNTLNHLGKFGDNIKAVYLEKHGANILFKSSADPQEIINFIKENLVVGVKVK